jgi:hypothetical protein
MRVYHRKWNEAWEQVFGRLAAALEQRVADKAALAVN